MEGEGEAAKLLESTPPTEERKKEKHGGSRKRTAIECSGGENSDQELPKEKGGIAET